MNAKRLGRKIREKRKQCGLTSQQLANLCHVHDSYIRQLESGKKVPSMPLLLNLCDELETSPNYLLEYAEDGDDKQLLNCLYKLSPEQKNAMICMLDAYITFEEKKKGEEVQAVVVWTK